MWGHPVDAPALRAAAPAWHSVMWTLPLSLTANLSLTQRPQQHSGRDVPCLRALYRAPDNSLRSNLRKQRPVRDAANCERQRIIRV